MLRGQLREAAGGVIGVIQACPCVTAKNAYLRYAISLATRDRFIGVAAIGVVILPVLVAPPRRFLRLRKEAG